MFGNRGKREPESIDWTTTVTWVWYSTDAGQLSVEPDYVCEDTEQEIRRIVREELADLVPVDVPDAPPEDLR